jgi:hypothetical protein
MAIILNWFSSPAQATLLRGRAAMAGLTASGLLLFVVALLIFWKVTKDLQRWTVVASSALLALLVLILAIDQSGEPTLACGLLAGLLFALAAVDVIAFGAASVGSAVMVLPILLAEFGLGAGTGGLLTLGCMLALWISAWGEASGHFRFRRERRREAWTFYAPAYSALYVLVAAIGFSWSAMLGG